MQSRLYINGREVQNPVARGFAVTLVLGILGLIFLALGMLFFQSSGWGWLSGPALPESGWVPWPFAGQLPASRNGHFPQQNARCWEKEKRKRRNRIG